MRFKIGGTIYDAESIDRLTLKDILTLEKETTELGHPMLWSDVQRISEEIADLKTERERSEHPAAIWMFAITIWASRHLAGESLTFGEAIDFPLADLDWLPEPADRQKPKRPTKAGRAGSARAAKNHAADATTSPPMLRAASTGG